MKLAQTRSGHGISLHKPVSANTHTHLTATMAFPLYLRLELVGPLHKTHNPPRGLRSRVTQTFANFTKRVHISASRKHDLSVTKELLLKPPRDGVTAVLERLLQGGKLFQATSPGLIVLH